jgi:hypothetical protein
VGGERLSAVEILFASSGSRAVEKIDGKLTIPLAAGADKFVDCSLRYFGGASSIPKDRDSRMAGWTFRIEDGSRVSVDSDNGQLNTRAINPSPLQ